jgi:hypothetical protein
VLEREAYNAAVGGGGRAAAFFGEGAS